MPRSTRSSSRRRTAPQPSISVPPKRKSSSRRGKSRVRSTPKSTTPKNNNNNNDNDEGDDEGNATPHMSNINTSSYSLKLYFKKYLRDMISDYKTRQEFITYSWIRGTHGATWNIWRGGGIGTARFCTTIPSSVSWTKNVLPIPIRGHNIQSLGHAKPPSPNKHLFFIFPSFFYSPSFLSDAV